MRSVAANRAYQRASTFRNLREQEADVFLRVNAVLRRARLGSDQDRARAIADNDRLWITLLDVVRDPGNALPDTLRAGMVSVGLAVQRESGEREPDFGFLIGINEQIAAGLSGA